MKPKTPEPVAPTASTLADAERTYTEAAAEVARLRTLGSGRMSRWTTRAVPYQRLTPAGHLGAVELIDTPHLEQDEVDPLERMVALRRLPAAELALLEAEVALEAARRTTAETARAAHAAVLEEGRRIVAAELPALIREQRALQRKWHALRTKLEAVDHRAGGIQHFAPASWDAMMIPGGSFDSYTDYVAAGYRLDLGDGA
jgi:hypothetical protein